MDIIKIQDRSTFLKCKGASVKSIMLAARDAQEVYLRSQFDIACTDSTALAVIEVAEMLGFSSLAIDLNDEYRKEVVPC